MVWACNLCDQGLESSVEMQEHMRSEHDRVVDIDCLNKDASGYEEPNKDNEKNNEKVNTERNSET